MKYFIEEAIIVETIEKEPEVRIETVIPEVIKPKRRKRRNRGLFSSIFDNFFGFDSLLDLFETDIEETIQEEYRTEIAEPEIALIVETNEANISEIQFFYAEIEQ